MHYYASVVSSLMSHIITSSLSGHHNYHMLEYSKEEKYVVV
jgi:hypothetical protein